MRSRLENLVDVFPALIVDKAESAVATGLLVHHQGRIRDDTELAPKGAERFLRARGRECPDEELVRLGRVGSGNGAFRVDLIKSEQDQYVIEYSTREYTYVLSVEVVLARHDRIDGTRFLEGQEAETARTTALGVPHDRAVRHLAELFKVHLERVCGAWSRGRNSQYGAA